MLELWVSFQEVSTQLGVAKDSPCWWIENKGLRSHKIDHRWKFELSDVDAWGRTLSAALDENHARWNTERYE